jgi:nitrilase
VPTTVPGYDELWKGDDAWMSVGRSVIVEAGGEVVAGPLVEEEGILYAELDAAEARGQRSAFDPVGHYARPDVFELTVHEEARSPVSVATMPRTPAVIDAEPAAARKPTTRKGKNR